MRSDPIRDKETVNMILDMLRKDKTVVGKRRFIMFATGIYLGRRISDMRKLKVKDVLGKKMLIIKEQKTGKGIELPIPPKLQRIYSEYLDGMDPERWLLLSTKPYWRNGEPRPISNNAAIKDMQKIQAMAKLDDVSIGTHTMRKTFGYHFYRKTHDIATLMSLFNHTKQEVTMVYIGITMDDRKKAFKIINDMYDT